MGSTGDRPEYKVYRARPRGLLSRLRGEDDGLDGHGPRGGDGGRRLKPPRERDAVTPRRVAKWILLVLAGWLLLSLVLFLVSAQLEQGKISKGAASQLSGSFPPIAKSTILVLGSDKRPKGTKEGGAFSSPPRADTIMLMRVGGGANSRLSVPRDTVVDIPGNARQKINAAYAIGGTALMTKTVKSFLNVKVDHVVEVDFTNFPKFIDTMGGIDIKTGCIRAEINGGTRNGGITLRLRPGEHHLTGKQALALSRVRKNTCRPNEDDLVRARRQQRVLQAIKGRVTSMHTFFRLPLVSWQAPKVIRTDMGGFTLLGLASALAVSGDAPPHVLKPTGVTTLSDGGSGLTIDDATKRSAVARFLKG
jgi:LCP family protein required for cell wall assembly